MLCFLAKNSNNGGRWDPADLARFRHNQGDLPDAERARILKKCLTDKAVFEWTHRLAKRYLAEIRLNRETEEITDQEAYEMLESLQNAPLVTQIAKDEIKDLMKQFRDQKRV